MSPTCGYLQPLILKSVAYLHKARHITARVRKTRCTRTLRLNLRARRLDTWNGVSTDKHGLCHFCANSIDSYVDMPLYLLAVSTLNLPNVIRTKRFQAVQAFMPTCRSWPAVSNFVTRCASQMRESPARKSRVILAWDLRAVLVWPFFDSYNGQNA